MSEIIADKRQVGWLSVALSVIGVFAGFGIGMIGSALHLDTKGLGFAVFALLQIVALVGGIAAWSQAMGRIGAALATVLLLASVLLLG